MNRELPKVSVVTITYGHEKYITETLDGVLMQQYDGPVEFIITNDNSPDATDEVVKKYFLENPAPSNFEIKYTKHETNKGMMPNFVWALEQATGEYIALCEGDDYWTDPMKLQKQVAFLEENEEYVLCFHDVQKRSETGIILSSNKIPEKNRRDLSSKEMCGSITIPTLSILFKNYKNLFKYGMPNVVNGDKVLITYLSDNGMAKFHPDIEAVYREHTGGIWSALSEYKKLRNNYITFRELSNLPFTHRKNLRKNALIFLKKIHKHDPSFFMQEIIKFSYYERTILTIKQFILKYK